MTLRITEGLLSRRVVSDLGRANQIVANTSQQVSTGRRITKPSSDSAGTERAMLLRATLAQAKQHRDNVDDAKGWAEATDDALGDMTNILQRVRELTVQGGNDTLSSADRESVALEIDQLAQQLKASGNHQYAGQYIFGGQKADAPPYDANGADAYSGDSGAVVRTIGPNVSVQLNITGDTILGDGTDGKALATLRTIAQHLRGGTTADADALRTTDLIALDAARETVTTAQAEAGALTNRLDAARSRLDDISDSTEKARSLVEDVDITQALTDLSSQQAVYQAALKSSSLVLQSTSLMDFLK